MVSTRLPTSNTPVAPTIRPPGLEKITVPPVVVPPAPLTSCDRTVPSNRIGTVERMRFRTTKSGLFTPLVKVAVLPVGRKFALFGRQSITAVLELMVTVSTPGVARL